MFDGDESRRSLDDSLGFIDEHGSSDEDKAPGHYGSWNGAEQAVAEDGREGRTLVDLVAGVLRSCRSQPVRRRPIID